MSRRRGICEMGCAATATVARHARRGLAGVAALAKGRSGWRVAAMVLGCAAASLDLAPSALAAFPGRNGLIAYTADCWGLERIATMRPDGTHQRLLRVNAPPCEDWSYHPELMFQARSPSWASDGRRVLFDFDLGFGNEVGFAVADADGSHRTVVPLAPAASPAGEFQFRRSGPSFAPDGRHFAYERVAPPWTQPEIWIASVDGREDRRLASGSSPRWAPDGRTIAYVAAARNPGTEQEREGGTWLMSARTGKPLRRLWRHSAGSLDWAPDGDHLVAAGAGVYILRADGKGARPLSSRSRRIRSQLEAGRSAVWSPDGHRIAYVHERSVPDDSGEFGALVEISTISARGTRARRIWKRVFGFDSDSPQPPPLSWQPRPR
jgi:dipeptidyl aminopeptidase/acylaminoacyl peptidase